MKQPVLSVALFVGVLLTLGGCGSRSRTPEPPPVVLSQAAWQQVDREIVVASRGATGSAGDYARRSMRVWRERVQARTEEDFIPWFTGYWTQQWLTLKVAWYKMSQNKNDTQPDNRLALYLQEQYRERVLEPVAEEINPDLIRERATELYVQLLGQQVQGIAQRYRAPPEQFALHLNRIPAIALGPPPARDASIQQALAARPFLQLPAWLALDEQIRKAAASNATASDTGLSSVASKASTRLEATLAPRGAASAVAAAVGKAAGLLISVASAGIGAMMHESDRPEMVEQLRVILNVALNEEWQSLMENHASGVMAGVWSMAGQIEGRLGAQSEMAPRMDAFP
ncbi:MULTISPECIES: hypothetical protein [unclassified Pseudomonas]|uniref:hypothetical protein n=1 Tax=unclassified Pseudomonas TaxID=196821 RepID=UPI002113DE99|nr:MULTISPECIES: hypothetical protein [unclassified Pseudomonas]MCU1721795.1 hypothetical protein [Pseudomonas sp. 5P_5.1_Bac1]